MVLTPSFGKKIPITQFQVQNNRTGEFENAVLFELDCRDLSDINHIEKAKGNFSFREQIITNMWRKRNNQSHYSSVNFYTSEAADGNIIGLCETYKSPYYTDITYLSSDKNKTYKYSGQTILASIGKITLKNLKLQNLMITTPLSDVINYYKNICGFTKVHTDNYKFFMNMDRENIRGFIKTVETRTNSKIIDLSS